MKNRKAQHPLASWKAVVLTAFLVVLLFACINPKKVQRWNDKHPRQAAEYAAQNFPCRPGDTTIRITVDDSGYNASINEMNQSLDSLNSINDELIKQLIICDSINGHQNINSPEPSFGGQGGRIQQLQAIINDLQYKLQHIKPKIINHDTTITIIDSAKAVATRLLNNELQKKISDQEKDLTKWKSIARIRFWMLISSGLLNCLFIGFAFWRRKKQVIEKITS